jgi:hypothetical protein
MQRMYVATYMAKRTLINVYPLFCNEGKILVFISYYYFYFLLLVIDGGLTCLSHIIYK